MPTCKDMVAGESFVIVVQSEEVGLMRYCCPDEMAVLEMLGIRRIGLDVMGSPNATKSTELSEGQAGSL